jgi:hypothetical protein
LQGFTGSNYPKDSNESSIDNPSTQRSIVLEAKAVHNKVYEAITSGGAASCERCLCLVDLYSCL